MKKLIFLLIGTLMTLVPIIAVPGYQAPVDVIQPDGRVVTLLMHGDEFLHFTTTIDGYTVCKRADGFYCYATRNDQGQLTPTDVIASNPTDRSSDEQAFVSGLKKKVRPEMTAGQKQLKTNASLLYRENLTHNAKTSRRAPARQPAFDYSKFKGLIILAEFSDCEFITDDPKSFYQRLTSEKNYVDDSRQFYPVKVEGSARDYFFDNSMGMFDPVFDVVGPVKVKMKSTEVGGANMTNQTLMALFKQVLTKANDSVNFAQYDLDNNGYIDMVYFIFSGYGSYVQGNDKNLLWPHASDFTYYAKSQGMRYDNKYFGRYACSVEISDLQSNALFRKNLDGIGTICHEFSHVLGLADHYDTNEKEDGMANHPSSWDLMAGGTNFNYGLTPVGYNSFERHLLGFADPEELTVAGNYELEEFASSNQSYILKTEKDGEVFYIENRQNVGWDRFLPSHGMLIWRVDTSEPFVWQWNRVNADASHMYMELLCATPGKQINTEYTPFPGKGNVSFITSDSDPALKAFSGEETSLDLFDITETDDIISFTAGKIEYKTVTEDFEKMALTTEADSEIAGDFCSWSLANASVQEPVSSQGNGNRVVKMVGKSTLTSTPMESDIRHFSFKVWTGAQMVKFSVKTSKDQETWTTLADTEGRTSRMLSRNSNEVVFSYEGSIPAGTSIQIQSQPSLSTGSSSAVAFIDDLTFRLAAKDAQHDTQGIANLSNGETVPTRTYNLMGQEVEDAAKGLVIRNGKKYLVK